MRNKPQKGNQLNGCHAGPFNRNTRPSTVHKLPCYNYNRFIKQGSFDIEEKKDALGMNVETLIAALKMSASVSRP